VTRPNFAHASEAELARILDYYQVVWQYEPRTFPILFNLDGAVVESFSPDFFLPDLDLYVELTTLRQSLVRKKNRKLRRLRELYPEVRIKLFYAKDFKALLLKYGRFDLAASLSGEEGQARPVQPALEDRTPAMAPVPLGAADAATRPPALPAVVRASARRSRASRRRRHAPRHGVPGAPPGGVPEPQLARIPQSHARH
jgi:hypoxanthine phosphoribosyltransferase